MEEASAFWGGEDSVLITGNPELPEKSVFGKFPPAGVGMATYL